MQSPSDDVRIDLSGIQMKSIIHRLVRLPYFPYLLFWLSTTTKFIQKMHFVWTPYTRFDAMFTVAFVVCAWNRSASTQPPNVHGYDWQTVADINKWFRFSLKNREKIALKGKIWIGSHICGIVQGEIHQYERVCQTRHCWRNFTKTFASSSTWWNCVFSLYSIFYLQISTLFNSMITPMH